MEKLIKSFSGRLTRTIILIVLVTMAVISVLAFLLTTKGVYSSFKAHYTDAIKSISHNITINLEKVEVSAVNIADEIKWHLSSPEMVMSTLSYEIDVNRNLTGCGVAFVPEYFPVMGRWFEPYASVIDGQPSVHEIGSVSHDYFETEWYKTGISSSAGNWSRPYLDTEGAGTLLCTYTLPIRDPSGKLAGVLGADISLEWLSYILRDIDVSQNRIGMLGMVSMPLGDEALEIYSFILGPGGEYIAHPDKERFRTGKIFYDYADQSKSGKYMELGRAMCSGKTGEEAVVMDGRNYEVFFAPVSDSGWSMAIAVPAKRLLVPALTFGFAILILTILGLVIVSRICRAAIRRYTRPLVQLSASAMQIAHGKFDVRLPKIETEDEIRLLRDSFDNMQKSLSSYIKELTETTAQKASIESELDVARKIQMSMLPMNWPAFPERDDLDIYAVLAPAKAVGGDLYDFRLRDGKLFFCIGDVSGKGIPASLVMTEISSMFRTLSAAEDSPARIMYSINSSMAARNSSLMFVTLFVGVLDLSTSKLRYTNAGHNSPVIISGGKPRMVEADSNIAVGIMPDWDYSLQEIELSSGSVLFLYTDGLTEASRSDGEMFREEGMMEKLAAIDKNSSAESLINEMLEAVNEFVEDSEQSDDLTILAIKK